MKKYFGIFVLTVLTSVFSCRNDEVDSCMDCGNKVEEVSGRLGFVFYDQTAERYFIDFFSPGSDDVHTANYVCDLPEKFRKIPAQVVISGTLFETSLRPGNMTYAQAKVYCLKLSSVKGP